MRKSAVMYVVVVVVVVYRTRTVPDETLLHVVGELCIIIYSVLCKSKVGRIVGKKW